MRVIVIGSGGREHALAWKLSQDTEVIVAPGNAGIADDAECVDIRIGDHSSLLNLCKSREPDLVIIGPEDPLIAGLGDLLRDHGFSVFGPNKDGARLEGSKAYSKEMMLQAGVPTAKSGTFENSGRAKDFVRQLSSQGSMAAVKASGNALGKGVVVAQSIEEADAAIDMMMVDRALGDAGATVLVEERLLGFEFSLLSICSGTDFISLPVAQDYKRAQDGDLGPNTGGMGTYSPVPAVDANLVALAEEQAVAPMLQRLKLQGIDYRGVLFSGFMVRQGTPYCLEYNVRFGDPETQSVMRRLGLGLFAALRAAAKGDPIPPIEVLDNHAVTVVMASAGYPGPYEGGLPIHIPSSLDSRVKVFHAGTRYDDANRLATSGGRVLGVSGVGDSLAEARAAAYQACDAIQFDGKFYRRDIAASPV